MLAVDILKKRWGYDSFRPLQEEIIQSVLQGCDTLALLPTGGGKSLCYQLPALLMEGLCLVVSPLISLMKDQVQQLHTRGIKAVCLTSELNNQEQFVILNNCIHGKYKLLYVSPERLRQRVFIEHFRQMKVSMIAVDEAHCISQWGYDFRPSYLEIARFRRYCPTLPMLALTATATPAVVQDIVQQLEFRQGYRKYQSSFVRSNLSYRVYNDPDKLGRLLRIARAVRGCGIVYVRNRRRTREIAQYLASNGVSAAFYHAGMPYRDRDLSQQQWSRGEVDVMVATNAFGMGIDKADVRYIVHLDIPSSVEAYYQEVGRAGRDGQKAYAILLYDEKDLAALEKNFETSHPSPSQLGAAYRALCNYYQLPVGSGEGCAFDFDIEGICSTYRLNLVEFYNAVRLMEREGLIELPELGDARSTVFIPIGREELYRFQVEQHRYGDLMTTLLRMYGGMFTEPVPISERDIARRIFIEEEQIVKMLLHMDALKVIVYHPKRTRPQIVFTSPRVDVKELFLYRIDYAGLKQAAYARLEAMRKYATACEGCRSQYLASYFGEEDTTPCGLCDHCLRQTAPPSDQPLRESIMTQLRQRPMRLDELQQALGVVDDEALRKVVRALVDKQEVSIDARFRLWVGFPRKS